MVRVVLPFLAGYYLSYVFRAVNAVLGPGLAAEFNLNAAQLGLLTGIYFFSFGLVQVPLGVVLDRFGPRRVNGALLVLAAAGGFAFANAHSYEALVLSRAWQLDSATLRRACRTRANRELTKPERDAYLENR